MTMPLYIREDNSSISIQTEHKDIEIHIKYRNKKWVTNSKGAPLFICPIELHTIKINQKKIDGKKKFHTAEPGVGTSSWKGGSKNFPIFVKNCVG